MNIETKTAGSGAILAAAAAAASSSAMAADLPFKAAAEPPLPAATWQGFYVGGSIGASWLNSTFDDSTVNPFGYGSGSGTRSTAKAPGWLLGAQAGYNWQDRNFVYGLEGDVSFLGNNKSTSNGTLTTSFPIPIPPFSYAYSTNVTRTSKIYGFGTLRARFGIDFAGTMPYITAGLALGDIKNSYTESFTSGTGVNSTATNSKTSWVPGIALGGGVEHHFTNSPWTLRAEVLWIGFQDKTLTPTNVFGYGTAGQVKFSNDLLIGRIGMNYRF